MQGPGAVLTRERRFCPLCGPFVPAGPRDGAIEHTTRAGGSGRQTPGPEDEQRRRDGAAGESEVFFLDVREPKELVELGTLEGYVNIPLGQIESRLSEIPKDKAIITA
jgi:hypothetical protein